MPFEAMRIFGDLGSGNCQKVKLTAEYLELSYRWVPIDIMKRETRTTGIVRYLARGSALLPEEPFEQAKCDELMYWEQYSHEPYVAVARFQMVYLGKSSREREARLVERGDKALDTMERLLHSKRFFVGDRLSVADIALLPYTRLAHEGGFDLTDRPAVRAWIADCEAELRMS